MRTFITSRLAAISVTALAFTTLACSASAPDSTPAGGERAADGHLRTPSAAPAPHDPEWHYEGEAGPARWGQLSPDFAACEAGRSQSPIDIGAAEPGITEELEARFPPVELRIAHHEHIADGINNGHTIQINYPGGDTLMLGGTAYELVQYHFHNPSEHAVAGKRVPMEMHMVHRAADGRLAVVGVLIAEGAHNAAFDPVWANLPAVKGVETHMPSVNVDVDALLPAVRTSYRYEGSLTTPPCSEGVKWIVMSTPIELSTEQIRAFTALVHDNNRPLQALNGRRVVTDAVAITPGD